MKNETILLAMAAGLMMAGCFCTRTGATGEAAEPKPFRVATFNMRTDTIADRGKHDWTNRVPLIAKVIEDNGFDIVGAQELKENQIADLRRLLGPKGFDAVGRGRLEQGKSEGVYILFDTNRFSCVESGTFQLSETPEVWGSTSWGSSYPRICAWARLKDRSDGKDVLVYDTHLDNMSELARQKSAELILERMKAESVDGAPAFLVGDFNCPARATNAVGIVKREMRDAAEASRSPHQGPDKSFHGWNPPAKFLIDYMFAKGPVLILEHKTHDDAPGGALPSDHLPISVKAVREK